MNATASIPLGTITKLDAICRPTGWVIFVLPTGWALCDGTNGTPDLRRHPGRWIMKAAA